MKKSFDFSTVHDQPLNMFQVRKTYQKAIQSLKTAKKIKETDPEGAYTMAYESMLKASLALMFSTKKRPRVQMGHHKVLVRYAEYILGEEFTSLTNTYDKMRDKRNKLIYDINIVSKTEAEHACAIATKYLKVAAQKIIENNPQLKLW